MLANTTNHKRKTLPYLGLESPTLTTRQLQAMTSSTLEQLKNTGPSIVVVGGVKQAVLVDYDQYWEFQKIFNEMFKLLSKVPKIQAPDGYSVSIDELKLEIKGTLHKIVSESPESSPFADLFDAILGLAEGFFSQAKSAPSEITTAAKTALTSKKIEKIGVKPRKPNL